MEGKNLYSQGVFSLAESFEIICDLGKRRCLFSENPELTLSCVEQQRRHEPWFTGLLSYHGLKIQPLRFKVIYEENKLFKF